MTAMLVEVLDVGVLLVGLYIEVLLSSRKGVGWAMISGAMILACVVIWLAG